MVLGALWRSLVLTTLIGCMFVGNINGASKIKGLATMIKKFNTFTPLQNFEIPLEPENTLATSFYTKEKGNEPAFYQRYTDLMRRGITDDTKFMVFRKHPKAMGWGNRIRGTISSFVLALLTGRVMIIEHEMFESHFLPYERDGVLVDWRPLLAKDICTKENTKWVQKDMMTNVDIKTELAEKR